MTAARLLGYGSISLAHLATGIFANSSRLNCSSSFKLDGFCWCTAVIPQILNWIEVWCFDWAIPRHLNVSFKPLDCCFSSTLRVIVLMEGEALSQSQISGRLKQASLKNFLPSILTSFPVPADEEHPPQHDAAITLLHCGDGVLGVMKGVGFAPILDSSDQSAFFHIIRESPTCLLANTKCVC